MFIILFAGIIGICAAIAFDLYVPSFLSSYFAMVITIAMDSALGAYKSLMRDKFNVWEFLSEFFSNSCLAILMVFLGKKIELDLYYAVIIVFVFRIFNNFTYIRRYYLKKICKKLKKC